MSTFLERLEVEKKELNENLIKLDNYIEENEHFKTLSNANQLLLLDQRNAMNIYLNILSVRI